MNRTWLLLLLPILIGIVEVSCKKIIEEPCDGADFSNYKVKTEIKYRSWKEHKVLHDTISHNDSLVLEFKLQSTSMNAAPELSFISNAVACSVPITQLSNVSIYCLTDYNLTYPAGSKLNIILRHVNQDESFTFFDGYINSSDKLILTEAPTASKKHRFLIQGQFNNHLVKDTTDFIYVK